MSKNSTKILNIAAVPQVRIRRRVPERVGRKPYPLCGKLLPQLLEVAQDVPGGQLVLEFTCEHTPTGVPIPVQGCRTETKEFSNPPCPIQLSFPLTAICDLA